MTMNPQQTRVAVEFDLEKSDEQEAYENRTEHSRIGRLIFRNLTHRTGGWDGDLVDVHFRDGRITTTTRKQLGRHMISTVGVRSRSDILGFRQYGSSDLNYIGWMEDDEINEEFERVTKGPVSSPTAGDWKAYLNRCLETWRENGDTPKPEAYTYFYETSLADALCMPRTEWVDYQRFFDSLEQEWSEPADDWFDSEEEGSLAD